MIEIIENANGYTLTVSNHIVISSNMKSLCLRIARILESCRNMPYRAAIKTIIEDIGFEEDTAQTLYGQLFEHSSIPTVLH